MSISIEYNQKEQNVIILTNLLKMLNRRGLIDDHEKILKSIDEIKMLTPISIKTKSGDMMINITDLELKSISSGSQMDEFLNSKPEIHKIVIFNVIAKKVVKQVNTEYKNVEFFFRTEMMEDVPSKNFIPEHQLLSEDYKKELLSKFAEQELGKIFISDFMSRYYGAKVGDIFRIIRPSITSGQNIYYRKVINSSWDILFD